MRRTKGMKVVEGNIFTEREKLKILQHVEIIKDEKR